MGKTVVFTEEELKNIYHLYFDEHKSFKDLKEIYHHEQPVFTRVFKEHGWKPKAPNCKYGKYKLNEHYFDVIDTPDKAYVLGLFYADGNNNDKQHILTMELQIDDYDVLAGINNLFETDRPIRVYDYVGKSCRTKPTCKLTLYSPYLCQRASELNLVPRKSLSLDFPYWMDKELIPFMLRGYIDGDGWVRPNTIGFMSSDKFCNGAKQYFDSVGLKTSVMNMKRHYNEHTKTFIFTNKKDAKIYTEMMFAQGNVFMQRKVDKYIQYGFLEQNNSLVV